MSWCMRMTLTLDDDVAAMLERLRLRTFSVFEELTAAEMATGFERLEAAVAADPDKPVPPEPSTLLTLIKPRA